MPRQIVIQSFGGLGDFLFVTPTLKAIKEAKGDKVFVEFHTHYSQLLQGNPYVDAVGRDKSKGIYIGYPDPISNIKPTCHHIISDFQIIKKAYHITKMKKPDLQPLLFLPRTNIPPEKREKVGIQVIHKGQWFRKKVWPRFSDLVYQFKQAGIEAEPIPKMKDALSLARKISNYKAVVCAEGGISHLAKALNIPAVVIFGGFASPEWSGYPEHVNLTAEKGTCPYMPCYGPFPCYFREIDDLKCLNSISIDRVITETARILEQTYG